MKKNQSLCTLATLAFFVSFTMGCSQKISALNDTLKLAFVGEDDVNLSAAQISAIPYASTYIKIDDVPQAFVVLALAEPPMSLASTSSKNIELKWLSADKAMLVTVNGRLVRTHHLLTGNLVAVASSQPDPLTLGLHRPDTPKYWERHIDWQPGYHFGYPVSSQFTFFAKETIEINGANVNTLHYIENVTISSLSISYQNDFWLTPDNGLVIKSRQKIAPEQPFIEMTILKPYQHK